MIQEEEKVFTELNSIRYQLTNDSIELIDLLDRYVELTISNKKG